MADNLDILNCQGSGKPSQSDRVQNQPQPDKPSAQIQRPFSFAGRTRFSVIGHHLFQRFLHSKHHLGVSNDRLSFLEALASRISARILVI